MDNQGSTDNNTKLVQDLARQLAGQFSSIRRQGSDATHPLNTDTTSPSAAQANNADNVQSSSTTDIAALADQLGMLLNRGSAASLVVEPPVTTSFEDVPDPSIYEMQFAETFNRVNSSVLRFEDRDLLDMASEQMDIGRLFEEAEAMAKDFPEDSTDDIVIRRLLHWFKNDYFTWVNEPPCQTCQGKTVSAGGVAPSPQERQDGAGAVETYRCVQSCPGLTRFPRYGGMSAILFKTRRGRCGEWANCFTVLCRALGYNARYVHDTTDHVWTEVWSEHKKRWIHCDSCEAAYDQPLLYSTGWGKSLSYCVAFSAEEVVDVTRRYTVDYSTVVAKRRRSIREPVLAKFLHRMSEANLARLQLTQQEVLSIRQRQALEADDLSGRNGDRRAIETRERESGSDEWTKARGERH
ncbi:peptide-N4-(N-acetyl-beta-glucosaminyl) asparagine amidase [Entomortierella parvispora]|uniref:Peptide-N4-(N-acetyl-beta-glucosaminyl) asparagine amidase n=1 Tax=Entomortierella parvispora TaxID=205924 RepID=A0A9P3HJH0_9FUNG|nr:peptide-N4-(N-acetyl-beta-glucosaminyl) asparagine amidase [Entomortierella parvispora]